MRLKLAAACVGVFAFGLALKRWVSPALSWVASLPTCESLPWVRLELVVAVLFFWLFSYASFKQARATLQFGQTPLPNTWVWSRTKVRTGNYAKLVASMLFLMSSLFFLGPIGLIAWQELYVIFWPLESCGC